MNSGRSLIIPQEPCIEYDAKEDSAHQIHFDIDKKQPEAGAENPVISEPNSISQHVVKNDI